MFGVKAWGDSHKTAETLGLVLHVTIQERIRAVKNDEECSRPGGKFIERTDKKAWKMKCDTTIKLIGCETRNLFRDGNKKSFTFVESMPNIDSLKRFNELIRNMGDVHTIKFK